MVVDHVQLHEFINYGGPHWGIEPDRLFNYLSNFADNWLKGVHMYQDDICDIISQSDHPFNS